ncbi:MAG: decaprenyl-phosphate phosphoribosyltransferase [Cyanobacteriota bacterium]
MIKNYLSLLRPHQYLKNLFIFMPLIFSLNITNIELALKSLIAFIAFSLIASAIYIINDIKDLNEDKNHPTKKLRPITSGKITVNNALKIMSVLLCSGLSIAYILNIYFLLILSGYLIMNLLYSFKLKHIAIIDIIIIAVGFVLRVFSGAIVINVPASEWLIIMTFLLALFLALAKRRDDVLLSTTENIQTRKNIDGYNLDFINASMIIMASIVIVAYIMYTVSNQTLEKFNSEYLYLSTIFVITGLIRYLQITLVENNSGSPTNILIKDRFLQITIILWLVTCSLMIYWNRIIGY